MTLSRKHILRNTAALLRLGVSEADIERTIAFVEAHLPPNADEATWIPTAADLQEDGVISESAQVDARQAWYASKSVDRKYRRLLDARGA
jgi:hypothetical protein